jgi:very-short-patch-repair endonuclease
MADDEKVFFPWRTPKRPKMQRPYPRTRPVTGIRRFGRGNIKRAKLRQERPRRHARPWKWRPSFDQSAYNEARAAEGIRGSLQERIVYKALIQHGFIPELDFTFQSNQLGGRMELGGLVADFLFEVPKIVVQVQSYWHTLTMEHERRDEDQYVMLQMLGYTVLEIWPSTIMDPAALDWWFERNIMTLWGTSTQGIGGGFSNDTPYLCSVQADILNRINATLDALIDKVLGGRTP